MSALFCIFTIVLIVIPNYSNAYTKLCDDEYECKSTTITCPENENCDIKCTATASCQYATINCPFGNDCTIECTNDDACFGATINGKDSSKLQLIDCAEGDDTCSDMTIYCPPNDHGTKKCFMAGDEGFGGSSVWSEGMQFYAIYGWNDIDFSAYSGTSKRIGTLYCTADYSHSCETDANFFTAWRWICDDRDDLCMDPPTKSPTTSPTFAPTTSTPTVSPTNKPSIAPTIAPTTAVPTSKPTLSPTIKLTVPRSEKTTAKSDAKVVDDEISTTDDDVAYYPNPSNSNDVVANSSGKNAIWIIMGVCLMVLICGILFYCHYKKRKHPPIFHTEHHNDIEMVEDEKDGDAETTKKNVIINQDGMETIVAPKKGKIKYSPLGALNINVNMNMNMMREHVSSQSYLSENTESDEREQKQQQLSLSHPPTLSNVSSIKCLDSFVLDASNDDEIMNNAADDITPGTTPYADHDQHFMVPQCDMIIHDEQDEDEDEVITIKESMDDSINIDIADDEVDHKITITSIDNSNADHEDVDVDDITVCDEIGVNDANNDQDIDVDEIDDEQNVAAMNDEDVDVDDVTVSEENGMDDDDHDNNQDIDVDAIDNMNNKDIDVDDI